MTTTRIEPHHATLAVETCFKGLFMHDRTRSALLKELLCSAQQLGVEHLSLGVNDTCVNALVDAGAIVSRTVIAPASDEPYVVDMARLVCSGLVVSARRKPQPASPDEIRALESDQASFHLGDYKAIELQKFD